MATTPSTFASNFLRALGLPTGNDWQNVVNMWVNAEGGWNPSNSAGAGINNPLNAHLYKGDTQATGSLTIQGKLGSETLAKYPSLDAAIAAYTGPVFIGSGSYGYSKITSAKTPQAFADAITASGWAQLHYGGNLGSNTTPPPSTPSGTVTGSLTDWFKTSTPTFPLNQSMINAILGDVPVDNPNYNQIKTYLNSQLGKPINTIGFNADWFHSPSGGLKDLTYLFPPLGQAKDAVLGALIPDVQSAIMFLGVLLVAIVFIAGSFLVAKNDHSNVVVV